MALSPAQARVAASSARFRVLIAGRRFGKTYLCMRELARWAAQPGQRVWYVAPTYRMARQILWDPLKTRLMDLRWVAKKDESDLRLDLVNGSSIALRGADNPDSLRGVGLDAVILDEFADIDEKAWTEVLRPTLSDRQGQALFCGTPKGMNWAYDLYLRGLATTEHQWESWQMTTIDGGRVPAAEIESAARDLDQRTFRQEYLASWETNTSIIYYAFDRAESVQDTQITSNNLHIGMDFNCEPMSAVVFVKTARGLHAIDEIVIPGSNTDEMAQEIRHRYPRQNITIYPDPAGRARKTSAGGRTDHSILSNAGFQVRSRSSHPPVRDRINAVNSLLCNSLGERRLTISPACRRLIECLSKQTYKPGTQIPEKDGMDHANDAAGYAIEYLFPITKTVTPAPSERWGVRVA